MDALDIFDDSDFLESKQPKGKKIAKKLKKKAPNIKKEKSAPNNNHG